MKLSATDKKILIALFLGLLLLYFGFGPGGLTHLVTGPATIK